MAEKINVKTLAIIALAIIIILIIGFIVARIIITNIDKSYEIEKIAEEDYKYFVVYTGDRYGVIDSNGTMIIENIYSNVIIPNPTKAVFIVTSDDGISKVLNENAEEIFTEFSNVEAIETTGTVTNLPYEKSVLKYEEDGKFGLIDYSGKAITKAIYEEISSVKYKEGEILAKKNEKYGVINNQGKVLIDFEYEEIEADKYYADGGYAKSGYIVKNTTSDGYRYGYISSKWKVVLDTEYTSVSRILDIDSEDIYLIASKNGQYGVVKNKNIAIDFAYQSISYNQDTNLFIVERSGQYGVLDIEGNVIVKIEYKAIKFNGIYILAKSYTEDTYFNKNGEEIDNSYTTLIEALEVNSYITIDKNNRYGIINENGNKTVENEYLYIEYVFDKYFVAYKEGQGLGVIDKEGKVYVEFEYDVLSKMENYNLLRGLDIQNNLTSIFSDNMEKLVSLTNAEIEIYSDYIEIYNDTSTYFITNECEIKTAKEILTSNKLFAICKDELWGYEDVEGNEKVECAYDYVTEFNNYGFAAVKKDGLWGVIDQEGNIVCECKFDFDEETVKPEFIGKYYKTYTESGEIYYTD